MWYLMFKLYNITKRIDMTKKCPNCNIEYKTYKSINKKTCSRECSIELKRKIKWNKYKCVCKQCGAEFMPKRHNDGGIHCSYKCASLSRTKNRVDRNGYWYVHTKGHPNASKQNYVAEHHLIMEEKLGHYIEDGYVVHHIDENKKNNDISNLQYMTDSDHKSLHARKRGKNGRFIKEL